MTPAHEDRQQLRGQGVEIPSTLQEEDDGFERVVRRRANRTSPKTAARGGSVSSTLPMEPPSYRTTEKDAGAAAAVWEFTPESFLQTKTLALK